MSEVGPPTEYSQAWAAHYGYPAAYPYFVPAGPAVPPKPQFTGQQVLDVALDPDKNDVGATSIRLYLIELLAALWQQGERFSGKRPFGNGGWESPLEVGLINAEMVRGSLDEMGYVAEVDHKEVDKLIYKAIRALA